MLLGSLILPVSYIHLALFVIITFVLTIVFEVLKHISGEEDNEYMLPAIEGLAFIMLLLPVVIDWFK